jgi:O-6-methylguanine DNA methyltransferase
MDEATTAGPGEAGRGVAAGARTTYGVSGWGVGTLWTDEAGVLAHEFEYVLAGDDRAPHADDLRDLPGLRVRGRLDPDAVVARLRMIFAGLDHLGDVPLELGWCTPFQRAVIGALRAVPSGEIVTYAELAAIAGYPNAQRAVGSLCRGNRFALLVPCHRVVAADGIGGYGATGVPVKRRLLALEGAAL